MRFIDDGLKDGRQFAGRGIDDLEYLSGRGLFQHLARLIDEPGIFDRDDRLRREILQQCDLFVGEIPAPPAERGQ